MYGLSLGVQRMPDRLPPIVYAFLSGMNASTVGIIALAAVQVRVTIRPWLVRCVLTRPQLAQKAIQDRLTRILVIAGACAGICYNALWYFPVLILIGGLTTVLWDVWLAQRVGKARAKWQAKRRRARNEAGDAEEISASPDVQAIELQVQRPEAVKRRVQAGGSTDRIVSADNTSEPDRGGSQRSTEFDTPVVAPPVSDAGAHNISVKLGISLIVGFLGE